MKKFIILSVLALIGWASKAQQTTVIYVYYSTNVPVQARNQVIVQPSRPYYQESHHKRSRWSDQQNNNTNYEPQNNGNNTYPPMPEGKVVNFLNTVDRVTSTVSQITQLYQQIQDIRNQNRQNRAQYGY